MWVIILSGAVALIIVSYLIHSGFKYSGMIGNIVLDLVYTPNKLLYTQSTQGGEIRIPGPAGEAIDALFVEKQGSKKLVIFCPESGEKKESWQKYASFLPSLGWNLLSVDYTPAPSAGSKNDMIQWPTDADADRLVHVVRWAYRTFGKDHLRVSLFGVSKGAVVAFAAAASESGVRGVVADGLFSVREIFRGYIRRWGPVLVRPNFFGDHFPDWVVYPFAALGYRECERRSGKKFVDTEKLLRQKHPPIFMIHGEKDSYAPLAHQALLDRMNAKRSLMPPLMVAGATHNEAVTVARGAYERKIAEFLEKIA